MIVILKDPSLFISAVSFKPISTENAICTSGVPRQLPKGVSEEQLVKQASVASYSAIGITLLEIIIQISLKGSLDRLWVMFFTLQIICYLSIYDVAIPANAEIYVQKVIEILEFQLINPTGLI